MFKTLLAALTILAFAAPAQADSWKHGGGHGRWGDEDYDDGAPWIVYGAPYPPVVIVQEPVEAEMELPPLPQGPQYGELYSDEQKQYCREYQTTAKIEGKRQPLYGTVCLQPDGAWKFSK